MPSSAFLLNVQGVGLKLRVNHKRNSELAQKLEDENRCHVQVTTPGILHLFIHLTIFVVAILTTFNHFTHQFVPII